MSRNKMCMIVANLLTILAVMLIGTSAHAVGQANSSEFRTIGWKLGPATIVEGGAAIETRQGFYVHDYSVKAPAEATTEGTPVKKGWFFFRGTVFSPKRDMPGQKSGYWYLQGSWTITARDADPKLVEVKHNPYQVEGDLRAELAYNPATTPNAAMDARILMPQSLAAGRWTTGKGMFVGRSNLEGIITLDVELRPDVTKPPSGGK